MRAHRHIQHSAVIALGALLIAACTEPTQRADAQQPQVMTLGASANIGKGDFRSHADLSDFKTMRHLYALGPVQHMGGEVLVIDSVPYAAEVRDGNIRVTSSWDYQPPFLVYSQVTRWREIAIPDDVKSYVDLESFLGVLAQQYGLSADQAFAFRLHAIPVRLSLLIMNRPEAPESADKPLRSYRTTWAISNEPIDFIGFFSTQHKGIFLGDNERVHTHAITQDRRRAGHVESFELKPGGKVYLPL